MTNSHHEAESILESLDDNQRLAAATLDGPVRIIAGAGSGKTRTITRRIANACVTKAWNPDATLAVTYTNKATGEMKNRLHTLGVHDVHVSTFHSAAYSQLRQSWYTLTHRESPEISSDMKSFAHMALSYVMNLDDYTDNEVRDVLQELSWMKVNLIAYEDYERVVRALNRELPLNMSASDLLNVAQQFETEKQRHNVIDFDDALLLLSHIYEEYEELADDFRQNMRHITIDEYQDVSALQHRVLTQWLGSNRDICVVGDPAQTIYSYAGASSYYLMNFTQEFAPLSQDIELNTDYRSSGHIVDYANAVLGQSINNSEYIRLTTNNEIGSHVHLARFKTDDEELRGIASRILWHAQRGSKLGDMAVLTRTRMRAQEMARICKEYGIDATIKLDNDDYVVNPSNEKSSITISTIHAAKGLEWGTVFITDCYEGNIPFNPLSHEDDTDHIEEERRIFYVALTRGINQVYLCVADYPFEQGYGHTRTVSRFIRQAQRQIRKNR